MALLGHLALCLRICYPADIFLNTLMRASIDMHHQVSMPYQSALRLRLCTISEFTNEVTHIAPQLAVTLGLRYYLHHDFC